MKTAGLAALDALLQQLPLIVVILIQGPLWGAENQVQATGQLSARAVHPGGQYYLGTAACQPCHAQIVQSFTATAHHRTSQPATAATIAGPLAAPKNVLRSGQVNFSVNQKTDGFYQTAHVYDGGVVRSHSERIDLVVGSNRKGQTYLHWEGDRLYQMPLSYFTPTDTWVYSPGLTPGKAAFRRPVGAKCLECHATFFAPLADNTAPPTDTNLFDRTNYLLGVSCERCHGPGDRHVAWHTANPQAPGRYTVNPATLSTQRQLDICALCHSGVRAALQPAFTFFPGDTLAAFSTPLADQQGDLDVHGNQFGLMRQSRCFQQSGTMTCSSCHDPHRLERTDKRLFAQRCAGCHPSVADCGMADRLGASLRDRCIDCHMPERPSRTLLVNTGTADTPVMVRTHQIAIYRDLPGLDAH